MQGGGGNDSITIVNNDGNSVNYGYIAGEAGDDTITITAANGSQIAVNVGIFGDSGADDITINALTGVVIPVDLNLSVAPTNPGEQDADSLTVNGVYTGPDDLYTATTNTLPAPTTDYSFTTSGAIHVGDGDDTIDITGGWIDGNIDNNPGSADTIELTDSQVTQFIQTYASPNVNIQDTTTTITISNTLLNRYDNGNSIELQTWDDSITINDGSLVFNQISTLHGDDTILVQDSKLVDLDNVSIIATGDGKDSITFEETADTDQLIIEGLIHAGTDADTIVIKGDGIVSNFNIDGGDGTSTATGNMDFDTLDLRAIADQIASQNLTLNPGGGNQYYSGTVTLTSGAVITLDEIEAVLICFDSAAMISTDTGMVEAGELEVGDAVLTADHGYQAIRWIGKRHFDAEDIARNPKLRPVRIRAGALGNNLPVRDLLVSRQHRMLVSGKIAHRMFDAHEVLVPAHMLLELNGIEIDEDVTEVTYVHFLCDTHQVVYAEGAPSESLYTGKQAVKMIPAEQLEELFLIFPELRDLDETKLQSPARVLANGLRARKMINRYGKNGHDILPAMMAAGSQSAITRPFNMQ